MLDQMRSSRSSNPFPLSPRRGFQCYGTHPASFLLSGRTRILLPATDTWKKSLTYRTGTSQPVRCVAFSLNCRFVAASSVSSGLWAWQCKERCSVGILLLSCRPMHHILSTQYNETHFCTYASTLDERGSTPTTPHHPIHHGHRAISGERAGWCREA
ncbi:MAG: hypothetical protein J3Q66DRAFT_175485 [Benniella sp.]|nr:MAG: hypothetical protein J3Q66DRAFT_175485 [Benniella sp.]